ncbi:MAG: metallophosphoesterase [Bryobacteraceae bacterium]|nr:metallophosphoesterase [Bryobacteraceae bacterium]
MSDTHVIDPTGVHPKLLQMRAIFAHTRAALPADLAAFRREWKAAFAFITGDLIDVYSFLGADGGVVTGQVEAFASIMAKSPLPIYPGLGNHDVQHYGPTSNGQLAPDQSNVEQAKAAWIRNVPAFRDGAYYAFQRDVGRTNWRFIMLNNGFYGHLPGPAQRPPEYGLGRGQADWLAAQCRQHPNDPLVLGAHIPPKEAALAEIEQALGERTKLTLLFTGHIHTSDFIERLPFASARVFHVATPGYATGRGHFRRVRLHPDRIELFATGKPDETADAIPIER